MMKTPLRLLIVPALLFLSPPAEAVTYSGSWKNTTFGSTGALTIDLNVTKSAVNGSADLDGPVFGMGDPPAIPFNLTLKSDGTGKVKITGTSLGTITGTYGPDGQLTLKISNIPGGFLTEARIHAKFNLALRTLTATYEVDDSGGLYAEGTAKAHAPLAPKIKVDTSVNISGPKGEVDVKVVSNTKIKSFKASSPDGATVQVSGKNPYVVTVTKIKLATTRVIITVTNADGLTSKKTVKFIRTDLKKSTLEFLLTESG